VSSNNHIADIAILGGGPGGYVAAIVAAQRGARVALVEKDRLGGTCLNVGCIPTKALLTSADLLLRARHASDFGLNIPSVEPDLAGLMAYKRRTVDQLVGGVEQLLKSRKVTICRGEGRLIKPDRIAVRTAEGETSEISAPRIILGPGSITSVPPIEGQNLPDVMTSTEALNIDSVPAHLVIIGGGVIGLEFACIYEALGSKVTVLELTSGILPGATDEAISKRLLLLLHRRGMNIQTNATVREIERVGDKLRVASEVNGLEALIDCDRVLVTTGRWPNTGGMGFAETGLQLNGRAIQVDSCLLTNLPNVWAIGDVVGGWMLAHKAMVDGRVAAETQRAVSGRLITGPSPASSSPAQRWPAWG
jgi:dihydrolipoamide dehydrogenase